MRFCDAYEKSPQPLERFIPRIATVMCIIFNELETVAENATAARRLVLAKFEAQYLREIFSWWSRQAQDARRHLDRQTQRVVNQRADCS